MRFPVIVQLRVSPLFASFAHAMLMRVPAYGLRLGNAPNGCLHQHRTAAGISSIMVNANL